MLASTGSRFEARLWGGEESSPSRHPHQRSQSESIRAVLDESYAHSEPAPRPIARSPNRGSPASASREYNLMQAKRCVPGRPSEATETPRVPPFAAKRRVGNSGPLEPTFMLISPVSPEAQSPKLFNRKNGIAKPADQLASTLQGASGAPRSPGGGTSP